MVVADHGRGCDGSVLTLTSKWRSWSSRVGDMSRGKIWLKSGPAPNSRALSVSWRSADLRCGGVPFFTLSSSFIILRSFISSTVSCSSSTCTPPIFLLKRTKKLRYKNNFSITSHVKATTTTAISV